MKFALLALAAAAGASLSGQAKLPDGPGKETEQRICGGCHGAEIVLGRQLSHDGWSQIVVNMIQRGAQGSDDEFADIVDYLTNTVSAEAAKINVNKASAKQLQTALEIPEKVAAAIVQYRGDNGAFKSLDDLKKVPGLDSSKVDSKKNKIFF